MALSNFLETMDRSYQIDLTIRTLNADKSVKGEVKRCFNNQDEILMRVSKGIVPDGEIIKHGYCVHEKCYKILIITV